MLLTTLILIVVLVPLVEAVHNALRRHWRAEEIRREGEWLEREADVRRMLAR